MRISVKTISTSLAFIMITVLSVSCSKQESCEVGNMGTLTFRNTNSTATLQVFINEFGRISVNGPGDVSVPPGETISIDLLAGPQNLKARFTVSSCSGGKCSISNTTLPERDVDLGSCQTSNVAY